MHSLISQSGHITYGIKEYICDTIADIDLLPIDGKAGSTAYVIEDSSTYVLSHKGEWKKKKNFNNGGSNEELEDKVETLTAENAKLTDANKTLNIQNTTLIEENSILSTNNQKLQAENNSLQETNSELNQTILSLKTEIVKLQKELENLTPKIEIENNTVSIPESIATINEETNTLIISEENSEIVGNKLILK